MIEHAESVNARLLKDFPKGFALDASHRPHITMLQRYVRTADLDKVYAAAGKVLASGKVTGMKLKAFKYYYIPSGKLAWRAFASSRPRNCSSWSGGCSPPLPLSR